ncbi:hypothetical protein GGF37_000078 [Kickxella alabastrina]|nr:hypothetical protein GGF37_000078 [Kickxella alabastrina]
MLMISGLVDNRITSHEMHSILSEPFLASASCHSRLIFLPGAAYGAACSIATKARPQLNYLRFKVLLLPAHPFNITDIKILMTNMSVALKLDSEFVPKASQLISACYTIGSKCHCARICFVGATKRNIEASYIDFGNTETLTLDRICPLLVAFIKQLSFIFAQ